MQLRSIVLWFISGEIPLRYASLSVFHVCLHLHIPCISIFTVFHSVVICFLWPRSYIKSCIRPHSYVSFFLTAFSLSVFYRLYPYVNVHFTVIFSLIFCLKERKCIYVTTILCIFVVPFVFKKSLDQFLKNLTHMLFHCRSCKFRTF